MSAGSLSSGSSAPLPIHMSLSGSGGSGSGGSGSGGSGSGGASGSDGVWEWQDDWGWKPYGGADAAALEQAYRGGESQVRVVNGRYEVDLSDPMHQVNRRTGFVRAVRRYTAQPTASSSAGGGNSYAWYDDGPWRLYRPADCAAIDAALARGSTARILGGRYEVDPQALTQTNLRTGYVRAVRVVSSGGQQQPQHSSDDDDAGHVDAHGLPEEGASCVFKCSSPVSGMTIEEFMATYAVPATVTCASGDDDDDDDDDDDETGDVCPICLCGFSAEDAAMRLSKCDSHFFHAGCLQMCMERARRCPVCSRTYGVTVGNHPTNGRMTVSHEPPGAQPLPGFENVGTFVVRYAFRDGVQTDEHPHPGRQYGGTRRIAYLPANSEGKSVLIGLVAAFAARTTFTIGRSLTTGADDVIVWNGIHHKTSPVAGDTYGFPDDTYFDRVREELSQRGILCPDPSTL